MLYNYYTSDGRLTLNAICRQYKCSINEVIMINSQPYSYTTDYQGVRVVDKTVSTYLNDCNLKNKNIEKGLTIKLPYEITGGRETPSSKYETIENERLRALSGISVGQGRTGGSLAALASNGGHVDWSTFNCYVTVYANGGAVGTMSLPIYPNEFSDSNSGNFNSQNLLGRSVDYQIYQGSSRSFSVTLSMHEELCSDYNYIHRLVSFIESACYPGYAGTVVQVPEIQIVIGSHINITGILTSTSASWKAPIIDGKLVNCDLSLSITETHGPFSMSEVAASQGRR